MQITYTGPATSAFHPRLGLVVAAGEVVDVEDEAAEIVLACEGWEKAGKPAKTKAPEAATTVDGE